LPGLTAPASAVRVNSNVRHHRKIVVALAWTLGRDVSAADLEVVSNGVFAHGRAQAHDGNAEPISCLVRDADRVVAGGTGRTEYQRLFVSYLWVAEELRGKGIARRLLEALELEAAKRGCKDALIETLDDTVASLYRHLGYQSVAEVKGYVGRFNRHIMLKPSLSRAQ
jgi:GNAT superfamily N-acetyltransferase